MKIPSLKQKITNIPRSLIISGFVAILALITLPVLASSYNGIATEPEDGTLTGNVSTLSDSSTSGGSAVKFGDSAGSKGVCAPFPSFPDDTCTGTSGTLPDWTPTGNDQYDASTDSMNIYTDNEVIQNVTMRAMQIYVVAKNVTFKNVKFVYAGTLDETYALIDLHQPATFEYCDIDGSNLVARGIFDAAATVSNTRIHDTGNAYEGAAPLMGNLSIKDSYIYNIQNPAGDDWHDDGIQVDPADGVDISVVHNTVLVPDANTSAMSIQDTQTTNGVRQIANDNILIKNNLIGGGGYTMSTGFASNYQIIDNYFTNRYHPKIGMFNIWFYDTGTDGGVVRSGNIIPETGGSANDNL